MTNTIEALVRVLKALLSGSRLEGAAYVPVRASNNRSDNSRS